MDFPDPKERLRRLIRSALDGAEYVGSRRPEARVFVIEARRPNGRPVELHFRGVSEAVATGEPVVGDRIRLESVGPAARLGFLRLLLPPVFRAGLGDARVRIRAGDQRIEIVCQDADWYEDSA